MESMQSPVKGLEKLVQELRQERQKSTSALQDRSRQKIEIEKLKTLLADAQFEIEGKNSDFESLSREHHLARARAEESEQQVAESDRVISELRRQVEAHCEDRREQIELLAEMQAQYDRMKEAEVGFAQTVSKLESAVETRTDVIEEMERDMKRQQSTVSQQEARINDLLLDLAEKTSQEDEHRSRLQRADVVAENYRAMQVSSESLRQELDETLARSSEVSSKLREAQNQNR
jgi:chromosome segregation ATPase